MQLHVRWIGSTPVEVVASTVRAFGAASGAPLGPLTVAGEGGGGALCLEAVLEAAEPRPVGLPELLRVALERGDDVLVVPQRWRPLRPRLALFDGDMTLLAAETIDRLAEAAGCGVAIAAITQRAMEGELDFESALRERVRALAGLTQSELMRVADEIPLMPGVRELLAALHKSGAQTAVLSGGFHFLLDRWATELAIDRVRANRIVLRGGLLSGELEGPVVDARAKAEALTEFADALHLAPRAVLAVGDGANDGPMLEAAGIAIGLRPKPALLASACGVVSAADLRGVLGLLDL